MRGMAMLVGLTVGVWLAGIAFCVWAIWPLRQAAPVMSSTKIFDRNGGLLYELSRPDQGERTAIKLEQASPWFVTALIASEDQRFFSHHGIDGLALARAVKNLALQRKTAGGASTLEQQIVKNLYFSNQPRSPWQKLRELVAAEYWSRTHNKHDSLETYVNLMYFGNQNYGLAAAARSYFNKNPGDLTLAESALLVGVLPGPSNDEPYRHYANAKRRQRFVLDRLLALGKISQTDYGEALASRLNILSPRHDIHAPLFVLRVIQELEQRYPDMTRGGYLVTTTLDPELQRYATETVTRRLADLQPQHVTDAAVIAVEPVSGEILTYVGSANYVNPNINGQVDMASAKRQPGSALKPFLYFTAFLHGQSPATVIADMPVRFDTRDGSYYPHNYGLKTHGPVSLRNALGSSLNIPAVKLLDLIGLPTFVGSLGRFGLTFPQPAEYYGLGLVLGGAEVSLIDTARAYGSLALGGKSLDLIDVLNIRNQQGQLLFQSRQPSHLNLFDDQPRAPQAAALVADVLTDPQARSLSFGEANLLDVGNAVAVKTGTTKDFRDNWAFGYTPDFVLGVWVGNADNTPMQGVSGITGAVPIWHDIMRRRYPRHQPISWPKPSGLIERRVCATSGLLASDICPKVRSEIFIAGNEPTKIDDWYVRLSIDGNSGLIAAPSCQRQIVSRVYLEPPAEYAVWQSSSQYQLAPTHDCNGKTLTSSGRLTIVSPLDGDIFERDAAIDAQGLRLSFIAGGPPQTSYDWRLNGQPLHGSTAILHWEPKPGDYHLSLAGADRQITFHVR